MTDEKKAKKSAFEVPEEIKKHKNYAGSPYKIKCTVTDEVKGVRKEVLEARIAKQEGKNHTEQWSNLLDNYVSNNGKAELKEKEVEKKGKK